MFLMIYKTNAENACFYMFDICAVWFSYSRILHGPNLCLILRIIETNDCNSNQFLQCLVLQMYRISENQKICFVLHKMSVHKEKQ
jgi:hypothetical protein